MTQHSNAKPPHASRSDLEGEGSYTATRRYNANLAKHLDEQDVEKLAEQARESQEGKEGEALESAERIAKQGPTAVLERKLKPGAKRRGRK